MPPNITPDYLASQRLSPTTPERFWKKVNKNGPVPAHCPELGKCWLWTSAKYSGYGWFNPCVGPRSKRSIAAHRVSWILHKGPIPDGMKVLHKCDNPSCENPEHLFLGDDKINSDDKISKGRDRNRPHKLSDEDVRAIRELSGVLTHAKIAIKFGLVGRTQITRIINGTRRTRVV